MVSRLRFVAVGAANFAAELDVIASLLPRFPHIVIDTEYPGVVHGAPAGSTLTTAARYYALVKANVDEVPVLQLGITLCDDDGNFPVGFDEDGFPVQIAWEFHFCDFNHSSDRYVPASVHFLATQGFDFARARDYGVRSVDFSSKLLAVLGSLLVGCQPPTWVAFGGAFDFAYMVKMLSGGQSLPETPGDFVALARSLLRCRVVDVKYMVEHCGRPELCLRGLRSVAAMVGVPPLYPAPPSLAGPKSLTACYIYNVMKMVVPDCAAYDGLIDGLCC